MGLFSGILQHELTIKSISVKNKGGGGGGGGDYCIQMYEYISNFL